MSMNSSMRLVASAILAVIVTMAAFYLMHAMISGSPRDSMSLEPASGIRFGPVDIPEMAESRDRRRPPPPPPAPNLPPPAPELAITRMVPPDHQLPMLDRPALDLPATGSVPTLSSLGQFEPARDGDAVPLVRIQPVYPRNAEINRIEGWVRVAFTIDETGSVHSAHVVDSQPPGVFDNEAVRAILRWKFEPRIVEGQPVTHQIVQTIEFRLDDN